MEHHQRSSVNSSTLKETSFKPSKSLDLNYKRRLSCANNSLLRSKMTCISTRIRQFSSMTVSKKTHLSLSVRRLSTSLWLKMPTLFLSYSKIQTLEICKQWKARPPMKIATIWQQIRIIFAENKDSHHQKTLTPLSRQLSTLQTNLRIRQSALTIIIWRLIMAYWQEHL